MRANHILVRYIHTDDPHSNDYTLEIYYDGGLAISSYIVVDTYLSFHVVALAQMLGCPLRLWQFNPAAIDLEIIERAVRSGVEVQDMGGEKRA